MLFLLSRALPDAGDVNSPTITVTDFIQRISRNVTSLSASSLGQMFVPYLNPKRSRVGAVVSFALTLILLTGFIQTIRSRLDFTELYFAFSLLLILGWGFSPTRFLVVLMPMLLQYFGVGVGWLAEKAKLPQQPMQTLMIALILAGFVATHLATLSAKYDLAFGARLKNQFVMFEQQRNLEALIQWMKKNIPADEVIATDVPALIYLHTNHRTVHLIDAEKDRELWQQLGIRHVVLSGITIEQSPMKNGVQLLFSTENQKAAVYEVK